MTDAVFKAGRPETSCARAFYVGR